MVALSPTPVIETSRLVLRAPAGRDFAAWRDFFLSDRSRFIRTVPVGDEALAWRAWAGVIGHWVMRGWGSFVVTTHDSDAAIGMTGPWAPINWPEYEIGWMLWADEHEGKGLMTEAAKATLDHAFRTLKWSTAVSYIAPDNLRSIRLAERLGAMLDPEARPVAQPVAHPVAQPVDSEKPVLVYRHRKPEGLA